MSAFCNVKRFLRIKGTPAILEEYHLIGFSDFSGFLSRRTPFKLLSAFEELDCL